MAKHSYFLLSFLVLFHGCLGQIDLVTNRRQSPFPSQQPGRQQSPCQLQNLNVLEPKHRFKSEAGYTEFWDQNEQEFQCANVAFLRHTIFRKGLLLPSFNNAPQLIFVLEGQGIHGAIMAGCPDTYQTQVQRSPRGQQEQQQSPRDQHQKLRQFKQGDIIALPAGVPHWIFNNGQSQLVLVSLIDVGNKANQLDHFFRKFFLAGNPPQGLVSGGQRQSQSPRPWRRGQEEEEQQEQSNGNNMFSPFEPRDLADVLRIDERLARKIQNPNDNRGAIVYMKEASQLTSPQRAEEQQRPEQQREREEQEQREEEEWSPRRREQPREEEEWSPRRREEQPEERPSRRGHGCNGLEETYCTMRLRHKTDSSFADIFNPRAGRITTINSFNLPVLGDLQLSAERGVLYRNALYVPHWNLNAHTIVYITRGQGRVQIVSENGDSVFNEQVRQGQVFVVPQNFVVFKRASEQGLEWVSFKTSDMAKISQVAGRNSFFQSTPVEVLAAAFDISREEAFRLKENRQELTLFSPSQQQQ
ncbi:11-S seed storage protein, plant [Corchorus olitorius]|uniref:11-S seed storage protein, plant n=1 Tax=Corchorus olitorius TaxID=93759 RepID=A0A1R3JKQ0_9ROSI|nr:11-S seed storage protein, plant [Corchorus olitorius]